MVNKKLQTIASIVEQPFNRLRIDVASKYKSGQFTPDDMKGLIAALQSAKSGRPEDIPAIKQEVGKVLEALHTGQAPSTPKLDSPSLQLLWGGALAYAACNPEIQKHWGCNSFAESNLWKQLTRSPYAMSELAEYAYHIYAGMKNADAHVRWGVPGSWYYFKPDENLINLDLMYSLIDGVGHARSVAMHEIGHSQLTTQYPPSMQAIRAKMAPLIEKQEQQTLTDEEYGKLVKLQAEWKMRHDFMNPAEDNCVNAFTVHIGDMIRAQDYGVSMNHTGTVVAGYGKQYLEGGQLPEGLDPQAPEHRLAQLKRAIALSYYQRNGLFDDTKEGWQSLGIDQSLISGKPELVDMSFLAHRHKPEFRRRRKESLTSRTPKDDFKELHDLCSGPGGISELQPDQAERQRGAQHFNALVDEYAAKRMAQIDKMWDRYAAHLAEKPLQDIEKAARENAQNGTKVLIELPFETPEEERNGAPGVAEPGKPSKEGAGASAGEPGEGEGEGAGAGRKGKEASPGEDGKGGAGAGEKGDKPAAGGGEPGAGAEPGEGNPDPGISIEELLLLRIMLQAGPVQPAKNAGKSDELLEAMPKGVLNEYQRMVQANMQAITATALTLKEIQKKQLELATQFSEDHQLTPSANVLASYDPSRSEALLRKIGLSGRVQMSDLNHFRTADDVLRPAPIDVVLMIDGSSSMYDSTGDDNIPSIDKALQVGTILNEAARLANLPSAEEMLPEIHVHLMLWGNNKPYILSEPGDTSEIIAQRIADIRSQTRSWGTSLAPALKELTHMLAKPIPGVEYAGGSHVFIAGDGDIADNQAATIALRQLADHCPTVTVDTIIINDGDTGMEKTVDAVNATAITNKVGMVKASEEADIKNKVVDLAMQRMRSTQQSMAIPSAEKISHFNRASLAMQKGLA